ncbi:MAG: hypothetical protein K0R67_3741, partial [Paenibacillus sp.]|nr:hypothetical protein [Paenibacillus sp.]
DKEAIRVLAQPNLSSLDGNVAKTSASWSGITLSWIKTAAQQIGTGVKEAGLFIKETANSAWTEMKKGPLWLWALTLLLVALPSKWAYTALSSRLRIRRRVAKGRRSLQPFDSIWAKLGRKLGARRPEQTVREYVHAAVQALPEEDQREALLHFAGLYETARYSEEERLTRSNAALKKHLTQLWSRITRSKST